MKIALLGYGKMGKLIADIATQNGHTVIAKLSSKDKANKENLAAADVCIDFSHPSCILDNIKICAELQKNIVVGTTGWYDHLEQIEKTVKKHQIGLFYSPNFSVGVNLFLQIVEEAAKLINNFAEYDVGTVESHHNKKADSPSGTAKAIANTLVKNIERKKNIVYNTEDQIGNESLHVSSLRCGFIPGSHSVLFDSHADTITLCHQARNREGFARGAVAAAEWLHGKKGLFTMKDLMTK